MYIRIRLSSQLRQTMIERAVTTVYTRGQLRLYRRIQGLYIVDGKTATEVAELLQLAEQTVRNYVHAFILQAVIACVTNLHATRRADQNATKGVGGRSHSLLGRSLLISARRAGRHRWCLVTRPVSSNRVQ